MKKILSLLSIVAVLVFFTPIPAFASGSPTIEASANNATSDIARISSPQTLSYNFSPSGANTMLFVTWADAANDVGVRALDTETATWNGTSMTACPSNNWRAACFYLVNPADTGTHDIVVSWSTGTARAAMGGNTVTGVNQASPIDTDAIAVSVGDTLSVSASVSTANTLLVDVWGADGNTDTVVTKNASQTLIYQNTSDSNGVFTGSSQKAVAGTGSQTMSWTKTSGTGLQAGGYILFAAIKPAQAAAIFDFGKFFAW